MKDTEEEEAGHAPRERVSWNQSPIPLEVFQYPVTLHVSVWVEIDKSDSFINDTKSRSTWACELKL